MRIWSMYDPLKPADAKYVGRSGKGVVSHFGNWFPLAPGEARGSTLINYVLTLVTDPELIERARQELAGHDLVCFCAPPGGVDIDDPLICHAQVLARAMRGDYDDAPAQCLRPVL